MCSSPRSTPPAFDRHAGTRLRRIRNSDICSRADQQVGMAGQLASNIRLNERQGRQLALTVNRPGRWPPGPLSWLSRPGSDALPLAPERPSDRGSVRLFDCSSGLSMTGLTYHPHGSLTAGPSSGPAGRCADARRRFGLPRSAPPRTVRDIAYQGLTILVERSSIRRSNLVAQRAPVAHRNAQSRRHTAGLGSRPTPQK